MRTVLRYIHKMVMWESFRRAQHFLRVQRWFFLWSQYVSAEGEPPNSGVESLGSLRVIRIVRITRLVRLTRIARITRRSAMWRCEMFLESLRAGGKVEIWKTTLIFLFHFAPDFLINQPWFPLCLICEHLLMTCVCHHSHSIDSSTLQDSSKLCEPWWALSFSPWNHWFGRWSCYSSTSMGASIWRKIVWFFVGRWRSAFGVRLGWEIPEFWCNSGTSGIVVPFFPPKKLRGLVLFSHKPQLCMCKAPKKATWINVERLKVWKFRNSKCQLFIGSLASQSRASGATSEALDSIDIYWSDLSTSMLTLFMSLGNMLTRGLTPAACGLL